jgi:hypothetical protein
MFYSAQKENNRLFFYIVIFFLILSILITGFVLRVIVLRNYYSLVMCTNTSSAWIAAEKIEILDPPAAINWYLSKLSNKNTVESKKAAERLGYSGCIEAMPKLLEIVDCLSSGFMSHLEADPKNYASHVREALNRCSVAVGCLEYTEAIINIVRINTGKAVNCIEPTIQCHNNWFLRTICIYALCDASISVETKRRIISAGPSNENVLTRAAIEAVLVSSK